jgi:hypothetical protein
MRLLAVGPASEHEPAFGGIQQCSDALVGLSVQPASFSGPENTLTLRRKQIVGDAARVVDAGGEVGKPLP